MVHQRYKRRRRARSDSDSMYCSLDNRLSDRYDDMTAFDEDALESVGRWLLGEDVPEVRE